MANIGLYGQLIRKSSGDTIDADLIKGVPGRVVVTSISFDTNTNALSVDYLDESNTSQQLDITVGHVNPTGAEIIALIDGVFGNDIWQQGLTGPELNNLNAIESIIAKTADLEVKVSARVWGDVTDIDLGGFASENSGNLGPSHAAALAYVTSKTATAGDTNNNYVYIRIPTSRSSRDYRIRQDGSLGEFFIVAWNHVGTQGNFDYYRSRHNLFQSYNVTIQYDSVTAVQTHYRGETDAVKAQVESSGFDGKLETTDDTAQKVAQKVDDLPDPHQLTPTETNDGDSDVFGEVSGERVAGAIDAHHTNQYTWLTELRLDYREPQSSTEPQFHVLDVTTPTTHDRVLEFSHLTDNDADFIRSIIQGIVVNVEGSFFTVFAFATSGTDLQLQGEFDTDPVLLNLESYRLRFTATRPASADASDIDVDTSNFSGKLAATDDTVQKVADKVDDFVFSAGGGGNPEWTDVQNRPNRPNAAELLAGNSVDEATPSVSDVVALVNNHRLVRSNADPENVGNTAEEGDAAEVSRRNHAHRFPHNNTIAYDPDADNFGINIHDVTEHTGQTIRYFTNENTFTNGGGLSEGQIYSTSGFRKLITKVQLQTSNILEAHFRVRIKTVDGDRNITGDLGRSYAVNPGSTNPHSYPFYDADGNVGIIEEGNQRIAIILEGDEAGDTPALRYGDQESDSPGESYPDASVDFHLENDVVYADRDPAIGQHTHSHGNRIRGNIKIFYQLIYGHDDLGSEIEPSDATPQENTTDGSAGDSDDYSRGNHAHPGTAGGGSGEEVLFDNRELVEAALSVPSAPNGGWHSSADVPFNRALVAADDDKDVRIRFRYTQNNLIRSMDEIIGADVLRNFTENNSVRGTIYPAGGAHAFLISDGRANFSSFAAAFPRLGFLARGRATTGEDVLRMVFNVVNNITLDISSMRGTVELVPRVGGGTSQQQAGGGGRILRTREVAVGDTLIAANNFDFDLSGDGQIALGRYALNPTPRSDIFDFIASIRVGSRAAFPLRLSREQFDYIGEYDLQDTWPFGGTGGGSWGNVTEIPCAMLSVDHRSEGVTKTQLRPQRQQISWTIDSQGTAATAILFFFSYNTSGNVDFVEMIVFTDQVVEIEGMHLHYWGDA